jgi:hypothetical protein
MQTASATPAPRHHSKDLLARQGFTGIEFVGDPDIDHRLGEAFTSNQRAKSSQGAERAAHYATKDRAICALIKKGAALIDSIDISPENPVIGVSFVGGGMLHITKSGLDKTARTIVIRQLLVALDWQSVMDREK